MEERIWIMFVKSAGTAASGFRPVKEVEKEGTERRIYYYVYRTLEKFKYYPVYYNQNTIQKRVRR